MNAWQGVMAVLSLTVGVATAAQAREPDVQGMRNWSLPGYQLYAPADWYATKVAERLPLSEEVLARLMGKEPGATGVPAHIYIAPLSLWQRYLQPSFNLNAEFVPARFNNYLVLNSNLEGYETRRALVHEYTHYFLRSQFSGEYPLWFDEGLAQLIENADFGVQSVRIGIPEAPYVGPWVPVHRMLRADKKSPEYLTRLTHAFHYQSWVLVHKCLIGEENLRPKLFAYLRQVNDGVDIDEALQTSFGMNAEQLEREMQRYSHHLSFKVGKLALQRKPRPKLGPGQRMSDQESLELLARLMLDTGLNPARLGEVIAAAKRQAPDSAAVRVLELRQAVRDGSDADVEQRWQALEQPAKDPAVARGAGLALFARIHDAISGDLQAGPALAEHAARAFGLLTRAEHALPVDAESAWALGLLSAWLNREPEFALQRLQLAGAEVPNNADLFMARALLHERLAQKDQLLDHLHLTARYARSVKQRLWAAQRIEALGVKAGGNP